MIRESDKIDPRLPGIRLYEDLAKDRTIEPKLFMDVDDHWRILGAVKHSQGPRIHLRGRLIALCGLAQSGKSTVAKWLEQEHGFERVRFADPLKAMIRTLLEFSPYAHKLDSSVGITEIDRWMEGDKKEKMLRILQGKSVRYAMQTLGTEWAREIMGQDIWVDIFSARAVSLLKAGKNVVCEDLRFPNEEETILKHRGFIYRIERPGAGTPSEHVSETFTPKHLAVIDNVGTNIELYEKFRKLLFID